MSEGEGAGLAHALEQFAGRRRVLVALDFDGCLAPITADPGAARMLPESAQALAALAGSPDVVLALVSGRGLDDLRVVADPPEAAVLIGSHGAEVDGEHAGASSLVDDAARSLLGDVVEQLGAVVAAHEGTGLERKATGAVLHTRRAEPDVAADATAAAINGPATLAGVHALRGKEVVELSVVETDKGTALAALRERAGVDVVLYAGDDTTDEHAFAVLDDAAGDLTVKVGDGDSAAHWRVEGPQAVADLLSRLATLRRRDGSP